MLYIIVPNGRFAPFGAEFLKKSRPIYMGVSLNGGTQQLLVFLLKITIWRSFGGTTILGNTHIPISMMTSERYLRDWSEVSRFTTESLGFFRPGH